MTAALTCCRKQPIGHNPSPDIPGTGQEPEEQIFSVAPETISTDFKGGDYPVSVDCQDEWKIEGIEEWMHIAPASGRGPASVTLTIFNNTTAQERRCSIRFKSGEQAATVEVSQGAMPQLAVATSSITTDGDGGVFDVLYMNDHDVTISASETWINILNIASSIKKLTFEVKRNTLDEERTGEIRFSLTDYPEISRSISVTQGKKIPHPSIRFAEGAEITISSATPVRLQPVLEDMEDKTLIWTSSDAGTAEVGSDGTVTIHKSGKCTITATNRHHGIEASIVLNVMLKAESIRIYFGEQDMDATPIAIRYVGEEFSLNATAVPASAYLEDLTIISSSTETVNVTGKRMSCLKAGRTTIFVESIFQQLQRSYTLIVKE